MKLNLQRPIAFFDLETTGVNFAQDRIVEISIVKILPDQTQEIFTRRTNPTIPIPADASKIHGIYDKDVANEPKFSELAAEVVAFLEGCDLSGYNCMRFDIPVLVEELLRAGLEFDLDSRKIIDVQQVYHKMEPRTLTAAYKFYCEKELTGAHGAEVDAVATYEVLASQLDRYSDTIKNDMDFLAEFTNDGNFVDIARRIRKENGKLFFNFGKHRDKTLEEIWRREPQYFDWMLNAEFPLHTKQKIREFIRTVKSA